MSKPKTLSFDGAYNYKMGYRVKLLHSANFKWIKEVISKLDHTVKMTIAKTNIKSKILLKDTIV